MTAATKLVAALAWPLTTIGLLMFFRRSIVDGLLPRLTGFKGFGIDLTFAEQALDRAATDRNNVTPGGLKTAHERLRTDGQLLAGARILWVDDNPDNNFDLRTLFERVGARIDAALTTEEAEELLARNPYELIITDWTRGNDHNAGPNFVEEVRGRNIPVTYYVLDVGQGRDKGRAFNLTNRPDQLVRDVLDILRRSLG